MKRQAKDHEQRYHKWKEKHGERIPIQFEDVFIVNDDNLTEAIKLIDKSISKFVGK